MKKLTFLLLIFIFISLVKPNSIRSACSKWDCQTFCASDHPWGCSQKCRCADLNSLEECSYCGPGTYCCNRPGGCCAISSPPPEADPNNPNPSCTISAPTNMSATSLSNDVVLNWTPGTHIADGEQYLWVSTNPDPQLGCSGSTGGTATCPVRADYSNIPLQATTATYSVPKTLLVSGTVYYWSVSTVQANVCQKTSSSMLITSCDINPSSIVMNVGDSLQITPELNSDIGIDNVSFINNPTFININPEQDLSSPFQTTITALNSTVGTPTQLTSEVYLDDGTMACSSSLDVTILTPGPWWQVKDGDISTNGNVTSSVPDTLLFNLNGNGGFPGIPVYGGQFNLSNETTKISTTKWNANATSTTSRLFNYSYFENLIPEDIIFSDPSTISNQSLIQYGYEWYKADAGFTLNNPLNLGSRKVILFVEGGDFAINQSINLDDNLGFFAAFISGDISVSSTLTSIGPTIEGIYLTDGSFNSGLGNVRFHVRGSIVSHGDTILARNLSNNDNPAEFFEFAPDQILLFPEKLGYRGQRWVEIDP